LFAIYKENSRCPSINKKIEAGTWAWLYRLISCLHFFLNLGIPSFFLIYPFIFNNVLTKTLFNFIY
jgi:hypothetical protein